MGSFGNFVFNFKIAEIEKGDVVFFTSSEVVRESFRSKPHDSLAMLKSLFIRIFDSEVDFRKYYQK